MKMLDKIMEHKKMKKFPGTGFCRVPGCGEPYNRQTGRRGMCKAHERYTKELVEAGEGTWKEVDEAWPAISWEGPDAPDLSTLRLSETEFQNLLMEFLIKNGHGVWVLDAQRRKGIPDLLIITKSGKVLFRELKANNQNATKDQLEVLQDLKRNGANVGIWDPEDLKSGCISQEVSEQAG